MKEKQVEFRCEDCRYRIDKADKMKNHRKKKHEEIGPAIEEETIEQRSEQGTPHHKLAGYQKTEEKEEKIRRKMGNSKQPKKDLMVGTLNTAFNGKK